MCKKYNIAIRSFEARSRSLLNRNADGIYKFAHKSILEYFLAKKAFQDLEFRKNITLSNFNGYDMAKTFLQEMSIVYLKKVLYKNSKTLKGASFQYLQLPSAVFRNVQLIDCNFEGCNLSQAEFLQTRFTTINFDKANLEKAVFHEVIATGGSFREANLYKADLRNIESHGSDFREANLRRTCLNNAKLVKANLEYTDLGDADLDGANLSGANLKGTELLGSNIMKAITKGKL
ncbi:pentapeptide repeat-containing protein [Lachnospiraceae bacterium MD335]|nr:pentapeptide repeat-containing protein [Lachnospiraceae bacterium MD335]